MEPYAPLYPRSVKESVYAVTENKIEEFRIERDWVDNVAWGGIGSSIMLNRKVVKISGLPKSNGIYKKSWGKFVPVKAVCAVVPRSKDKAAIYYIRHDKGGILLVSKIEAIYLWDEYPGSCKRMKKLEKRGKAGFVFLW